MGSSETKQSKKSGTTSPWVDDLLAVLEVVANAIEENKTTNEASGQNKEPKRKRNKASNGTGTSVECTEPEKNGTKNQAERNRATTSKKTLDFNSNQRYIIIDGSNVARTHGNQLGGQIFSCAGIKIAVDHFLKLGHTNVIALLPSFRRGTADRKCPTLEPELLDGMRQNNNLVYTPSRKVEGKLIIPYDDRFIIETAVYYNAIIVSNDNYRDLMEEDEEWKKFIEENLLQYSFVGDLFLVPSDPMGRKGPKLQDMLADKPKKNKATASKNIETKSQKPPVKLSDKDDKIIDNIKAVTNANKLSKAQKANSSGLASKNINASHKSKKLPIKELDENDKRVDNTKASAINNTKISNNNQSRKLPTKVSDTKGKTVENDAPPETNTKGKANNRRKTLDSNDKKNGIA